MAPLQILIGGPVMFVISQVKSSRVESRPVKSTDETAHTPFRPEVEDQLIAMFIDETDTSRDTERTRDAAPPLARADKYEAAAKAAWLARLNLPAWGRGLRFGGASSSPRPALSATRYASWPPAPPEATKN